MDGSGGKKWTVVHQTELSKIVKVRAIMDGPEIKKSTILKSKIGRSERQKVDGPEIQKWTVQHSRSEGSQIKTVHS